MEAFYDFLRFKSFISLDVLIFIYYLGALGLPVFGWTVTVWIKKKLWYSDDKRATKGKYQTYFIFIFLLSFVFMEIFWRVMFEFLIAYFQMRDVIVG